MCGNLLNWPFLHLPRVEGTVRFVGTGDTCEMISSGVEQWNRSTKQGRGPRAGRREHDSTDIQCAGEWRNKSCNFWKEDALLTHQTNFVTSIFALNENLI